METASKTSEETNVNMESTQEEHAPEASQDEEASKAKKHASAKPKVDDEIPGERRSERSRKPVAVFSLATENKAEEAFVVPVGPGTKLRDIPYLAEKVAKCTKKDSELLTKLYQVMHSRRYSAAIIKDVKEHILDFSGYPKFKDDAAREAFRDELAIKLCRGTMGFIHHMMDFLHIERSPKSFKEKNLLPIKDELVNRMMDWLEAPFAVELKKSAATTPKSKKKAPTKTTKAKGEPAPKKKRVTKKTPQEDEAETESDADDFEEMARKAEETMPSEATESPKSSPSSEKAVPSLSSLSQDLKDRVKKIMDDGDVEKLTLKAVMETLTHDLEKDVSMHKRAIKEFISENL
ncbi:hypothetical protein SDRG_17058 [Saprolegnia diclina VS20]|uniref:DEK-C domain-containing protein n=1 Tax=Saprolegnia diclina (strain VS20) TaxID=1156394 RepID=T0R6B4_SAPDV|nr:hypothetical protein SDRG_17058 [Saprolegnia diclina VS20]EQC25052.1 hypothetical protein SDRG_17058 [Saprolegnia diclina VS20]|eukprot:XP_008621515.1 hypothetical protein SDRG_17058 [Saprolegnia diclina VS20]